VQLKGSFALIDGDDLDWGEAGQNPAQMQSDLVERGADASKGRFVSHVVVLSVITRYVRVDLLCIDELGYMELDRRGAELLFQVLTEREEKNSIATS